MSELRPPPGALSLRHAQVRRAAHLFDHIFENLSRLGLIRLRHHRVRVLRPRAKNQHPAQHAQQNRDLRNLHPQSTEPPFTLMISPVMKLARSDAANRIGPAISSAVPGRPSGIAPATIFCPAFDSSTALDISVATHTGATQFTKMLCRANSVASPFVR